MPPVTNHPSKSGKPAWLKKRLPEVDRYGELKSILNKNDLHTICQSGNCPNIGECWNKRTATFMILGDKCTRACKFCAVKTGKPLAPDRDEPLKLAKVIGELKLKHCVITSVDRDDLNDYGASHWAAVVKQIKDSCPDTGLEVLIPDFRGNRKMLDLVLAAGADVVSHNMETVRRLSEKVRPQADYQRSLNVIRQIAESGARTKSGIMLGLGESVEEVMDCLHDLFNVGCGIVTIGQYLQPTKLHHPVIRYVGLDEFEKISNAAKKIGFKYVECAPLVRSSYNASRHML